MHLLEHLPDILLHTLLDTLKIVPFLFLTYLLMELLEHKSGDAVTRGLQKAGRVGPLVGGVLGLLPQCGFSAAATGLYTGRIITTGTLIAVYLSTSDEMLPILISGGAPFSLIGKVLAVKLIVGVLAGFCIDLVARLVNKKGEDTPQLQIEELCERERCRCGEHFALSALRHTASITLFILLFNLILNLVIHGVGEDKLFSFLSATPILGNLLAALVGLIPNCAASIALTELHMGGILSVGAMLSGLFVNAGVALPMLFRNNRPLRDSLRITLLLFGIGTVAGMLVDLLPIF